VHSHSASKFNVPNRELKPKMYEINYIPFKHKV